MEKKYNNKLEYFSEVMEEMGMNCLIFLVTIISVGSLFLLGR
jgi:hypothetical protein